MVKYILDELGLKNVPTVAYTGMAACVLRKKGNEDSCTIHRLIYNTVVKEDDETGELKYFFAKKEREELEDIELIVVDEYSMVPMNLVEDLLSFKIPIIFVGDRAQLQAIGKQNILEEDYFLDEPLRQALDNPIIYLANLARKGEYYKIRIGTYGDKVRVFSKEDFPEECLMADQIIACKNKTIDEMNKFYRHVIKGITSSTLVPDDKIMITKNNWNIENEDGFSLVNGLIGYAKDITINSKYDIFKMDFKPAFDTDNFNRILVDKAKFEDRIITHKTKMMRNDYKAKGIMINEIKFAYAITLHKAQGSSFNHLLFSPEFLRRDLVGPIWYTGITRAEDKLDIII